MSLHSTEHLPDDGEKAVQHGTIRLSSFRVHSVAIRSIPSHQRVQLDLDSRNMDSPTKMQYRFLGNTGTKVSVIALGGWLTHGGHTGNEVAKQTMKAAYAAGVNFFDSVSTARSTRFA